MILYGFVSAYVHTYCYIHNTLYTLIYAIVLCHFILLTRENKVSDTVLAPWGVHTLGSTLDMMPS